MSGKKSQDTPGGERRPIPLPPDSLRPAPRVRQDPAAPADLAEPTPRSSPMGSGRPWLIGAMIPALALVLTGLLYIWSPWEGFKDRVNRDPGTELQVRARTEQTGHNPSPVVGVPDPGEMLALQVASFRTKNRAGQVLEEAKRRTGLPGVVLPTVVRGEIWHRIVLGAFSSESEAKFAATPLLADGLITEILIQPIPKGSISELTGSIEE